MKKPLILFTAGMLAATGGTASAQNEETKSIRDMAEEIADYLATHIKLDDYQVFLVDSTIMHDYTRMSSELQQIQQSRATNQELYIRTSDKWMNAVDSTFKCIFNDEQWKMYMKTDYGREKRARDKRTAKRLAEGG